NVGESKASMDLGRRVVGQRDSGHDAMDVLVSERVEQHLIEYSSDSPPGHFACAIDRGRDAGVVGGSVVERSTIRIADDGAGALRDEHAMSRSAGVLFKPTHALVHREWF